MLEMEKHLKKNLLRAITNRAYVNFDRLLVGIVLY